jgi:hypothetical protein
MRLYLWLHFSLEIKLGLESSFIFCNDEKSKREILIGL